MYQWAEGSGDISWSSPASDGNNGISKRIDELVIRFGLQRNFYKYYIISVHGINFCDVFLDNPLVILLSKTGPDLHFSPTANQMLSMPTNIEPNSDYGEKNNEVSMMQVDILLIH